MKRGNKNLWKENIWSSEEKNNRDENICRLRIFCQGKKFRRERKKERNIWQRKVHIWLAEEKKGEERVEIFEEVKYVAREGEEERKRKKNRKIFGEGKLVDRQIDRAFMA